MAPRKRTKDKWLPQHVHFKHGAYYFVKRIFDENKTKKKWIWLGKSFAEAMIAYSKLAENILLNNDTMNALFDRYMKEVSPTLAESTHRKDIYSIKYLKEYFGNMIPDTITPADVYKYMDKRALKSKNQANTEKGLLSRVLSAAIRWGLINDNVCFLVKRFQENTRDYYLEDHLFYSFYDYVPPIIKAVMRLGYLTALREGDLLKIKLGDLTDEGIDVTPNKTKRFKKRMIITWSDELKAAVAYAKSIRTKITGFYLFCTQKGQPYTTDGFSSIWQRWMEKAIQPQKDEKTGELLPPILLERFMFKDIRAKGSTDAENKHGLKFASDLLGHSDQRITRRHYIKKVQKVAPVR